MASGIQTIPEQGSRAEHDVHVSHKLPSSTRGSRIFVSKTNIAPASPVTNNMSTRPDVVSCKHMSVVLQVSLVVIRLLDSNGDIVLTLSTPQATMGTNMPVAQHSGGGNGDPYEDAQLFQAMCHSLQFNDRSLLS